ncbi:MAG TPA: rhodanese-like domain-containing protein, partial [Clostridia bacterium]|nr:rhodanese-like domain-containing protein [Clostridia bacterium]
MTRTMMIRWLCTLGVVACCSVRAATPQEVRKAIEAGESLTLIDVRPAAVFMTGHLPNAINVPASLVSQKQLPPLGRVVVYDEGLGRDMVRTAVAALNQKPGIQAEILEGGLAAWEQAQSPTTASAGMQAEKLPFISYDHLKKTP